MKIIESVTIRYFRSVYTLTIKDCRDLTVITGKNDVGKSNIIKALNLFFNQQSDYLHQFSFADDYSIERKKIVKKDTIRGQQFISISVHFLRGDRMPNSLPPSFTVTKRWDMHSKECKTSSDVQNRMKNYARAQGIAYSEKITTTSLSTFLNRINFIYVPAIKDDHVFKNILNILQQSLFSSQNSSILDRPIGQANQAIQDIIGDLESDFEKATGIKNLIALPNTLNFTNSLLQVITETTGGFVDIDKRGDGVRSHFIPSILNYVANNAKGTFIWGFEEPENSYEYRRCIQVAKEFDEIYSKSSQIFITSHSPAFFTNESERKTIIRVGYRDGRTELLDNLTRLDEELGYVELYKEFIEQVKSLEQVNKIHQDKIETLKKSLGEVHNPVILTEGKTDTDLLKLAIDKLNLTDYNSWTIKPIVSEGTANNTVLQRYLTDLQSNMTVPMPIIGMFDRDTPVKFSMNGRMVNILDEEFVKIAKNIYAFAIPVPHNREEIDQISIEHYFTDQEIKTELDGKRLFLGNEFYPTGVFIGGAELYYKGAAKLAGTIKIIEHESKNYVTKQDGNGDYSISKARFVEAIKQNKDGFKEISFDEFRLIFNVLSKIMRDFQENSNNEQCM